MRKLFRLVAIAAAVAAGTLAANAQVGLEVGYAGSSQKLHQKDGTTIKNPQSGFYVELDYAVPLFGEFRIAPGIQYCYLAGESRLAAPEVKPSVPQGGGSVQHSAALMRSSSNHHGPVEKPVSVEHYLSIPVDLSYTFTFGGTFGLTAFVTPTLNCGLKSDLKFGNTSTDMYQEIERVTGVKDAYSRVDFLLGVGLAADFAGHFRIKFSYDFGLLNRMSVPEMTLHHNQYKIGIAFMF